MSYPKIATSEDFGGVDEADDPQPASARASASTSTTAATPRGYPQGGGWTQLVSAFTFARPSPYVIRTSVEPTSFR